MLYGREAEQAQITRAISQARDLRRSRALVVRGETGIGKSALLDWVVQHGPWTGTQCPADGDCGGMGGLWLLRVTGYETEEDIVFAGLNQLLWPVRDRLDSLPEPQRTALRGALGLTTPTETENGARENGGGTRGQDRFTVGLAVLTLLADLAEGGQVLCLIDDAQWLDTASSEALLFAARRLAAEGVVMLFAARDEGFEARGLEEMPLERLGPADSERVLAQHGDVPPALRDRIVRESAGNPLALIEFGAARGRRSNETTPLPLADRVTAGFRDQIARLPEAAQWMLLLVAAEGRGDLTSTLGAAERLGVSLADLDEAERARLVEVRGRSIVFRHPLIRAAVYQGAPLTRRLQAHRALAESSREPECGARHRAAAATRPDEDVAAGLERAAERARDRTGFGTAARLYRQAADLTPDPRERARRLGAAAGATLQAGAVEDTEELVHMAERLTDDPAEHARLVQVRAAVEFERGDPRAAARMLADHAARAWTPGPAGTGGTAASDGGAASDGAAEDRTAVLRTAAAYAWMGGETSVLCQAAKLLPSTDRAVQGMARLISGDYAEGLPLLAEAVAAARAGANASPAAVRASVDDRVRAVQVTLAALIVGDDDAALELASAEAAHCRRHGMAGALPGVLEGLAQAQLATGRHQDAEATAAEAIALARDTGFQRRAGRLGLVLARIAAIEGDQGRLEELAAAAPGPDDALTGAFGLLDLGLGRYDDALRRLERIGLDPHRPTADIMISAADQVEAAVRAALPDRARSAHDRLRAWADAGRQSWAGAVALRCEALLSDTEREPYERALGLYERALELHERAAREAGPAGRGGRPFEKARTELLYGEWLRRARRRSDARVPLRSALETFERLRAAPWAERARAELRATGESGAAAGGPRRDAAPDPLDRLTPQELQVVRLAADGVSSREIAAQLFLSPRTVEYHLYKAYPKLGVSSRKELSRLRDDLEPAAAR
ncbi:LuxR C-terminal-related transcriptional regulator [Actinomadura rugatobispora]|uniref:LuxR C-terminal-related transcriptional regulator n=1 Tax=Actinomadura rugatobispora TaxID=1994 RepID=A0ABW0ZQS6_9ACTN|nr:LuxR family transcriptional regulator [Actinomadura rugatobispora]